jgi:hypothetical protein
MLSVHEIKQIVEAHKEIFVTKAEFADGLVELRQNFSDLQTVVDVLAKRITKQDLAIKSLKNAHKQ